MINRERFLVVHGQDPKLWATRFDIQPIAAPCSRCEAACITSVPFASGQLRGLMSPRCACGNENTPYCLVRDPRFGDLFDGPLMSGRDKARR